MPRRIERFDPAETEYDVTRAGNGIRQLIVLITVAFMVTLGVVVGTRLSSDAIAVLVGVIAGVAASIPCALLLMAVTRRRGLDRDRGYDDELEPTVDRERHPAPQPAVPPVIVVTPGNSAQQQLPPWLAQAQLSAWDDGAPSRSQRQFRVMGYDESDEDE
jgi:hypothetical protein